MHVELKPWSMDQKNILTELCGRIDRSYLSGRIPNPYTEDDAAAWLNMAGGRDGKNGLFRSISADGRIVGNISAEQQEDVYRCSAEIGYFLSPEVCSQGIMTEAVKQFVQLAFSSLDIIRLTAMVYEPNLASRRVLEKNGFQLEGILKNAVIKDGTIYNLCLYGKLK